ncbi:hypothetical protein B9T31_12435 [Acinetobacter sp. ANC 4558]|uniref:hypothetical protein n=1 Tax=Acinetobacter sp. ANC 4558 TaxID=1977876 RepID=UPI000A33064B|nr:hypothetical protein [Acinetobacter sp. ANC 4558]OTG85279.1 hypothetical protein B9T31_12435 [Acinetobacter sp. ANC 4558]
MKKTLGLCLIIGVVGLVGCSGTEAEKARTNLEDQAVLNIKTKLDNPNAAQFRNQHGGCGEVNAKDSNGNYTGFKKYVVIDGNVIMEGEDKNGIFAQQWKQNCTSHR